MTPILLVTLISSAVCVIAWFASLITGDTSWVDRIWSVVPAVYVWVFAGFAHLENTRLDAMAVIVTIWGARLTFNFARKGGYSGVEDYRWAILRSSMTRWQFQIFNLLFIVLYQNFLLVLISLPAYTAFENRHTAFGFFDLVLVVLFLACTVGETIADQQQWDFHQKKNAVVSAGGTPPEQFLQTGLFRYARHPNYFFELAQWWLLFFMGALAARSLAEWTVIGVVLLTALFVGSTNFTEKISLSKYPDYANYQKSTSAIIPWFPRSERRVAEAFDSE